MRGLIELSHIPYFLHICVLFLTPHFTERNIVNQPLNQIL